MRKAVLKVLSIFLVTPFVFNLTACSSVWNEEYAEKYTDAMLSVICTGNDNPENEFQDIVQEDYSSWRKAQISEGLENAGLEEYGISDTLIQSFEDVFDKAITKVKYKVGSATKTDNGFSVPVTIRPVKLYAGIDQTTIISDVRKMVLNGEIDQTDYSTIAEKYFELLVEQLDKALDDPSYGDEYKMTIEIIKDSDGKYSISDASATEFGLNMFDVDDYLEVI